MFGARKLACRPHIERSKTLVARYSLTLSGAPPPGVYWLVVLHGTTVVPSRAWLAALRSASPLSWISRSGGASLRGAFIGPDSGDESPDPGWRRLELVRSDVSLYLALWD